MIARSYMQANLRTLNRLYLAATSPKEALFYSKLAILDLCGWIEESMDDIVQRCAVRCLRKPANRKYVRDVVVKKTWGFEYDRHFREMLIRIVGLAKVERLEGRIDSNKQTRLRATLGALTTVRNAEAHSHLKGVTKTINAPSTTLGQFNDVFDGLVEYDRVIRSLRAWDK